MTGALAGYLVLLVAVMAIFWPAVRDSADLQSFMRDLPAGVKAMIGDADYATAAGFLGGELFSFMVPLLMLVAWPFGALALLAGCATGRRSTATAVTVVVAAIAYLMHALAPLVDTLDGWDVLSPFSWYAGDTVLTQGLTVGHVIAPIGVAVVLCAVAAAVLERRDLASA